MPDLDTIRMRWFTDDSGDDKVDNVVMRIR